MPPPPIDGASDDDTIEEDVPEAEVSDAPPPEGVHESNANPCATEGPVMVRPIQIGEFMRKYVSRRLLALNNADTAQALGAMRQLGAGTAGGAEALATFHRIIFDAWTAGRLNKTLARVKVGEKTASGASSGMQCVRRQWSFIQGTRPL